MRRGIPSLYSKLGNANKNASASGETPVRLYQTIPVVFWPLWMSSPSVLRDADGIFSLFSLYD